VLWKKLPRLSTKLCDTALCVSAAGKSLPEGQLFVYASGKSLPECVRRSTANPCACDLRTLHTKTTKLRRKLLELRSWSDQTIQQDTATAFVLLALPKNCRAAYLRVLHQWATNGSLSVELPLSAFLLLNHVEKNPPLFSSFFAGSAAAAFFNGA